MIPVLFHPIFCFPAGPLCVLHLLDLVCLGLKNRCHEHMLFTRIGHEFPEDSETPANGVTNPPTEDAGDQLSGIVNMIPQHDFPR